MKTAPVKFTPQQIDNLISNIQDQLEKCKEFIEKAGFIEDDLIERIKKFKLMLDSNIERKGFL